MRYDAQFIIPVSDFQEKRFEIAKSVLASTLNAEILEQTDSKVQASMVFNSVSIADMLMDQLGYTLKD